MQLNQLRQQDLGELLGVTQTAVSQKLLGYIKWSADDYAAMSSLFNVSTDYLMGLSDEEESDVSEPVPFAFA